MLAGIEAFAVELRIDDRLAQVRKVEHDRGIIGEDQVALSEHVAVGGVRGQERDGGVLTEAVHVRLQQRMRQKPQRIAGLLCGGDQPFIVEQRVVEPEELALLKAVAEHAHAGFRVGVRHPRVPPRGHDRDAAPFIVTQPVEARQAREPDRAFGIEIGAVADRIRLRLRRSHERRAVAVEAVEPVGQIVLDHAVLQEHKPDAALDVAIRLIVVRELRDDVVVRLRGDVEVRQQEQQLMPVGLRLDDAPDPFELRIRRAAVRHGKPQRDVPKLLRREVAEQRFAVVARRLHAVRHEPDRLAAERLEDRVGEPAEHGVALLAPALAQKLEQEARFTHKARQLRLVEAQFAVAVREHAPRDIRVGMAVAPGDREEIVEKQVFERDRAPALAPCEPDMQRHAVLRDRNAERIAVTVCDR